jgi:hypothetical protein
MKNIQSILLSSRINATEGRRPRPTRANRPLAARRSCFIRHPPPPAPRRRPTLPRYRGYLRHNSCATRRRILIYGISGISNKTHGTATHAAAILSPLRGAATSIRTRIPESYADPIFFVHPRIIFAFGWRNENNSPRNWRKFAQ